MSEVLSEGRARRRRLASSALSIPLRRVSFPPGFPSANTLRVPGGAPHHPSPPPLGAHPHNTPPKQRLTARAVLGADEHENGPQVRHQAQQLFDQDGADKAGAASEEDVRSREGPADGGLRKWGGA